MPYKLKYVCHRFTGSNRTRVTISCTCMNSAFLDYHWSACVHNILNRVSFWGCYFSLGAPKTKIAPKLGEEKLILLLIFIQFSRFTKTSSNFGVTFILGRDCSKSLGLSSCICGDHEGNTLSQRLDSEVLRAPATRAPRTTNELRSSVKPTRKERYFYLNTAREEVLPERVDWDENNSAVTKASKGSLFTT